MKQAGSIAAQALAVAYLTFVTSLLFWSHAPEILGWQPRVVLTGSMAPVIRPGDVGVIGPAISGPVTLPAGRIVLVSAPEQPSGYYLHRVNRYNSDGLVITQGDANPTVDTKPVAADHIRGQMRLLVPLVGLPVVWYSQHRYLPLLAMLILTWIALAIVMRPLNLGGRIRRL